MTSSLTQSRPLFVGNAYLVRQSLTFYNPNTNAYEPLVGIAATLTVGFYTNALGTSGIALLTALPMVESAGAPGTYYASISAALTGTLSALIDDTIYQVVVGGNNLELRVTSPRVVTAPRFVP
jgi:hypothetical protein